MHAFDILGDPVRRRILELLAEREHSSGDVVAVVQREFGITQSAVSQHLKALRESGFASVRNDGTRRLYCMDTAPLSEVDAWLERFRGLWEPRLDALATEIARETQTAFGMTHRHAGSPTSRCRQYSRPGRSTRNVSMNPPWRWVTIDRPSVRSAERQIGRLLGAAMEFRARVRPATAPRPCPLRIRAT